MCLGVTRHPRKCGGAGLNWTGGLCAPAVDDETEDPGERPESESAPLASVFALPSVSVRTRSFARDAPSVNSSMNESDWGGVVMVVVVVVVVAL